MFSFSEEPSQSFTSPSSSSSSSSSPRLLSLKLLANGPMLKKPKIMEPCLQFRECGSCARFYSSLFYFNFYFILIYFIPSEIFSIVIPYSTVFVLYFNTFYCIIQSDAGDGIGFEAIDSFFLLIVATSAVPYVSSAPFVVSDPAF